MDMAFCFVMDDIELILDCVFNCKPRLPDERLYDDAAAVDLGS